MTKQHLSTGRSCSISLLQLSLWDENFRIILASWSQYAVMLHYINASSVQGLWSLVFHLSIKVWDCTQFWMQMISFSSPSRIPVQGKISWANWRKTAHPTHSSSEASSKGCDWVPTILRVTAFECSRQMWRKSRLIPLPGYPFPDRGEAQTAKKQVPNPSTTFTSNVSSIMELSMAYLGFSGRYPPRHWAVPEVLNLARCNLYQVSIITTICL